MSPGDESSAVETPPSADAAAPSSSEAKISVRGLGVGFRQGVEVLKDVSFEVGPGELVVLVGPSGCGKSTVLNAIASLIAPEIADVRGEILLDGQPIRPDVIRSGTLGYVFQKDSLFPWRTVLQNVLSGLEIHTSGKQERLKTAHRFIEMAGLKGFEDYFPHQISGGMRQRTSLIRTLAYDPEVILMDEPFGALDAHTRMNLQAELIKIWSDNRKTIIFVTHDLDEAITLGQRVILFSRRPGTVKSVHEIPVPHPRDPYEFYGTHEFAQLHETIWNAVSGEFRASSGDGGGE